jgi:Ser/Thr protein kinase RdoA (MazF antagonist)
MHDLAKNYPDDNGLEKIKLLRESYFIALISKRDQLSEKCRQFIDRAEAFYVELDDYLPAGLCHLDFDNGNVLTDNDRITAVLDFDDLKMAPYVMCLAYTLWDVSFDAGLRGVMAYLQSYTAIRELSELEIKFIPKLILFRHYVIGCKDIADDQMNDEMLTHYLDLEKLLLAKQNSLTI